MKIIVSHTSPTISSGIASFRRQKLAPRTTGADDLVERRRQESGTSRQENKQTILLEAPLFATRSLLASRRAAHLRVSCNKYINIWAQTNGRSSRQSTTGAGLNTRHSGSARLAFAADDENHLSRQPRAASKEFSAAATRTTTTTTTRCSRDCWPGATDGGDSLFCIDRLTRMISRLTGWPPDSTMRRAQVKRRQYRAPCRVSRRRRRSLLCVSAA